MRNVRNNLVIIASSILLSTTPFATIVAQNNTIQTNSFENLPTYNKTDLGCTIDNRGCTFKIWSPIAQAVRVNIYDQARGGKVVSSYDLTNDKNTGVWSYTSQEDLIGKFYTFQVKMDEKWLNETQGIWAKAVGVNGDRGAIIDFTKTNPQDWNTDKGPKLESITDAVIYEMHHRDFSVHPNSGIVNKGKFIAMLENGTLSVNGEKTGIDHLKELGFK